MTLASLASLAPAAEGYLLTLGQAIPVPFATERGAHLAACRYLRGSSR